MKLRKLKKDKAKAADDAWLGRAGIPVMDVRSTTSPGDAIAVEEGAGAGADVDGTAEENGAGPADPAPDPGEELTALAETMYRAAHARFQAAEAREQAAGERLAEAEAAERAASERLAEADALAHAAGERLAVADDRERDITARLATAEARERAVAEHLATAEARERAVAERLAAADARERAVAERLAAADARERAVAERDAIANQRDRVAVERDAIANQRDRGAAEREARPEVRALPEVATLPAGSARSGDHELEIARLEAELERSHLDSLTGALRREVGRLTLHNEIERARRADGRFVLAFVDVDDLKGINDREGHAAGDRVLRTLAAALRANLRAYDPVVRFGGDEFVCGVTGINPPEVEHRLSLIDQSLRRATGVGISAGVATLTDGATLDELTAKADAALMEAKRNRDR